ncbi:MAG: hypothetical protein OQK76_04225 [Gammaproteobacteria bacterium]|nr:hypothetical protein [Gammaproteobacteria bacterium]MCW8909811.1 hypothetical protein [Gammaproteobacteria bacterium]MCW9005997.1 hypothetical protein [Gammaproteobacteria bacterium]
MNVLFMFNSATSHYTSYEIIQPEISPDQALEMAYFNLLNN